MFKRYFGVFWGLLVSLSCSKKLLKVLRHSLIIWDALGLSEAISFVLSCSERFLKNLRNSLTFCRCLEVIRRYLRHFYWFQAGLKSCRRFWVILWRCLVVLRHSEVFLWILSNSKWFLNVLRPSLMFLSFLRCSNSFWGVFIDSETIPLGSDKFWDLLQHSEVFWAVLMGFEEF